MADNIETSANQKIIIVSKNAADKNHPYSIISLEASDQAAGVLTGNEFKLWYYLAKNQGNYRFALSRKDFLEWSGMSKNTYFKCMDKLEHLGYLDPKKEDSNTYIFNEQSSKVIKNDKGAWIEIEVPKEKVEEIKNFEM